MKELAAAIINLFSIALTFIKHGARGPVYAATTWSANCKTLAKGFEGYRSEAYDDGGGTWTLGYGHTEGIARGMTCTREQAEQWLDDDLTKACQAAINLTTRPLKQNELDALTLFIMNVGAHNFANSHLRKAINANHPRAVQREWMRWDHMDGRVLRGLKTRREEEARLYGGQ